MENAVEALKFAGAIMVFALALALSISSFSQASQAVTAIVNMRDRETEYTYVKPSESLTRVVGIETVVPSMYRAYEENVEIYFLDKDGNPFPLYYKIDNEGEKIIENGNYVTINYINLEFENFSSEEDAIEHLDFLLRKRDYSYDGKYKKQTLYDEGLYNKLEQYKFEEYLGEYYQGTGDTKIKKRVITYKITE